VTDRTDAMLALAACSASAREFLVAVAENPRTRRAAERFAATLLMATSAAEVAATPTGNVAPFPSREGAGK
jgi:hypothetical protein